jgi:hypothetical protein
MKLILFLFTIVISIFLFVPLYIYYKIESKKSWKSLLQFYKLLFKD